MDRLIEGYRSFRQTYWTENRKTLETLATQGQSPKAMIITCSDSRIDPQMMFGSAPGEIFVVRNIANLVPPYAPNSDYHGTSAALEFAVRSLRVEHVIVMGHARCGGIAALLSERTETEFDFLTQWMQIAADARDRVLKLCKNDRLHKHDTHRLCEYEGIKVSLANLMTFPWVRERVEAGDLKLHGWYFDLEVGMLMRLAESGAFEQL